MACEGAKDRCKEKDKADFWGPITLSETFPIGED
jgi:hypothetical protein